MNIESYPDLKAFRDAVRHSDRIKISQMTISIKTARIVASALDSLFNEISTLINAKADLKSQVATLEHDLRTKEEHLVVKEQELEDLRKNFDAITKPALPEPARRPMYPNSQIDHEHLALGRRMDNLEWRLSKLEHGVGTVEHLTREPA